MQNVKNVLKNALKIDYRSHVDFLKNLRYVGSYHHGYYIPEGFLNEKSICYCIGAGEDISFDTELAEIYGSRVYIFDPAPNAKNHFTVLKDKINKREKFTVGQKHPFTYRISSEKLETIHFIERGLWSEQCMIRFFKPTIANYPSHSIDLFNKSQEYIELPVDRLKNCMRSLDHTTIDLLKIEIEGAEYVVLDTILEDRLDIKMILVEFDELFHAKDFMYLFRIKKATEKMLASGYKLAHSTPYFKRLFVKEDIFEQLKSKESTAGKNKKIR
jgi:hypothetical protein